MTEQRTADHNNRIASLPREDRALDRLLHQARDASDEAPPSAALTARIISARKNRDHSGPLSAPAAGRYPRGNPSQRDRVAAAALLAASLVLGAFIGSTDLGRSTAESIGTIAGFSPVSSRTQTSALDEALTVSDSEEIL